jgi:hypothetical protein
MLKEIAKQANPEDIPETIVVISDMQIDCGSRFYGSSVSTEMKSMRKEWEAEGLKMPKLVYWNVEARGNANFLDDGPDVTYVSGCSPTVFTQVLTGVTGYDLMLKVLLENGRYDVVK